jgi:hypothetical protein
MKLNKAVEAVKVARRNLGKGTMVSSAQLNYNDAVELLYAGKDAESVAKSLRSLSFSVGVFHADYKVVEADFRTMNFRGSFGLGLN